MAGSSKSYMMGGVCITGPSHASSGLICQDAFAVASDSEYVVVVVSDGAGSAVHSDAASKLYVQEITRVLSGCETEMSIDQVRVSIIDAIDNAKRLLVERFNAEPRDFAATLVGAIARNRKSIVFHIGDGAAVLIGGDGEEFVSQPENGEYANETFFVTMKNWADHLRLTAVPFCPTAMFLMSDGVTPFALAKGGISTGFLKPIWSFLSAKGTEEGILGVENLLKSDGASKISNDDKTLAWAILKND